MIKHVFLSIIAVIVGILAAREVVYGPQPTGIIAQSNQTAVISPIPQLDQLIATK